MSDIRGSIVYVLIAIAAGAALPAQAGANAILGRAFGGVPLAVLVSLTVSTTLILGWVLAMRGPFPAREVVGELPLQAWFGGLLGAAYLMAGDVGCSAPRRSDDDRLGGAGTSGERPDAGSFRHDEPRAAPGHLAALRRRSAYRRWRLGGVVEGLTSQLGTIRSSKFVGRSSGVQNSPKAESDALQDDLRPRIKITEPHDAVAVRSCRLG